jgi:hypothetical protein
MGSRDGGPGDGSQGGACPYGAERRITHMILLLAVKLTALLSRFKVIVYFRVK